VRILTVGFSAVAAACLGWFHTPGSLAAQTPVAPQVPVSPTIFIDVGVVDDDGHAVTTVRPEDVRVVVDGERRSVVSLRFVHRGPAAETAARLADPVHDAPTAAERTRSLLLLVDENSIAPGQEKAVVGAAGRLLEELGAADQAAVASLPRPPARITLTTEAPSRQASLSRVAGRLLPNAPGDASQAAQPPSSKPPDVSVDAGAGNPDEQVRPDALDRDPARTVLRDEDPAATAAEAGTRGTIRALLGVIDGLRALPGLKTVVVLRQAASLGGMITSAGATVARAQDDRRTDVEATVSAAAQARAVIHLVIVGSGSARRGVPEDDLREIAEGTGGTVTLAKDGGDAKAFDGLLAALSGGYLVEVEATDGDRTARAHPIKIEVTRPRTVVRAARWWAPRNDPVPRVAESAPLPAVAPPPAPSLSAASPPASSRAAPLPPPAEPARRGAADDPELVLLLARVSEYLAAYVNRLSNVVAEEDYQQRLVRGSLGKVASRHLRSDLVIVRTDADIGWLHYRDVFEVDGKPVRDRDARVQKLFLDDPEGALQRGAEISREGARYNIGAMTRTTNWPTLALAYLSPKRIGGLSFRREGDDTIDGIKAAKLGFEETASPSLVRPFNADGDIPAHGTFWIDPANGRILKTRLSAVGGINVMTTTVVYKPTANIGIWLPAEMDERYEAQNEEIEGHAVYRNFRSFMVTTDMKIK
jgi:VWFA-related protein